MSTLKLARQLNIPYEEWEPNDNLDEDPTSILYHTLVINGLHLHLEAWAVYTDAEGIQRTVCPDYDDDLGMLHAAVHGDGHFDTVEMNGRDYIILASPFC